MFRPSDDATIFHFLIPSNLFAVVALKQAAEMVNAIHNDASLLNECIALSDEVNKALQQYAFITHQTFGKIYAYEINGFGSFNLMDDANAASLLSLPYLNTVAINDVKYQATRKFVLSANNPFFFKGTAAEGIGGPHAGMFMIWPLSIIMRALISNDDVEIKQCIQWIIQTHNSTGFMHESFNKDDPSNFTRKWFAGPIHLSVN